ncbi:hypothetical protein ACFO3U_07145 [Flavobacterium ponti]|uniref:SlyX family protein n=1 Tax=Flavobacterium ponti TaxID=665133 RepID=A0ABV9P763_9FLAO
MKKLFFTTLMLSFFLANSQTTIYNGDSSLNNNRNVSLTGKNLNFISSTANGNLFINGTSGKVGIGTNIPYGNFDVRGGLADGTIFSTNDERYEKSTVLNIGSFVNTESKRRNLVFYDIPQSNFNTQSQVHLAIEDRSDYNRLRFIATTSAGTWFSLSNRLQQEIFTVNENDDNVQFYLAKPNSFVGIGTTSFTDGSETYHLSVKGKVRAEEVKVYNTWADYVFNNDYNLKPLSEVESFIKDNGHLPNVPSASEIEEKGLMLGDMTKIQQEKIEELTLYLIKQNKEIEELKAQVKILLEKR